MENRPLIHNKSPGTIRDTRDMPQHNKSNIQQAYSQHQIRKKLKAILLKSGTKQSWLFSKYLFNTVLEVIDRATRQLEEIEGI